MLYLKKKKKGRKERIPPHTSPIRDEGDVTPTSKDRSIVHRFKSHILIVSNLRGCILWLQFFPTRESYCKGHQLTPFLSTMVFLCLKLLPRFDDQPSNPLRDDTTDTHKGFGEQWWHKTNQQSFLKKQRKAGAGGGRGGVSSLHKLLLSDPGDQPYWKTLVSHSSDKCPRTPVPEANLVYRGVHQGPLELGWGVWATLGGLSPG